MRGYSLRRNGIRRGLILGLVWIFALAAWAIRTHSAGTAEGGYSLAESKIDQLQPHPPEHREPQVDGAKHPELVPDEVAYSLFFRMITQPSAEGDRWTRAYIRNVVLAPSTRKEREQSWRPATDEEVNALLRLVETYRAEAAPFDLARAAARASGNSAKVAELSRKRQELIEELRQRLPESLGHELATRVDGFVTGELKRRVRIFDGPRPH